MSSTPILSVEGPRKRYGDQIAVDDLGFHVRRGQCSGLLGPNGASRTTTLRMLLGMTMPDAGSLRLCGEFVLEVVYRARMRVGVIPQFDNLDPDFFVSENLHISGRYSDLSTVTTRERIPILLELARPEQKADIPVRALSGGMKRRLTVVRVLINDPGIFIMGKPTIDPDPQAWHLIWGRLHPLLAVGKTILLTTHFMEEAEHLCDELCVTDSGRKIAQDEPQELIACEIGYDVVEACGDDLNALRTLLTPLANRVGISGETLSCYARDPQSLVAVLRTQTETYTTPDLRYLHRPANLEDMFLYLIGREMRN